MLRWYYSTDASTILEITDRVLLPTDDAQGISVGAHAEEGSGWEGTIEVMDQAGSLIMLMHRRIYAVQDAEASGSQVVGNWFITNLDVERADPFAGASRKWIVSMADENSLLERRIFVGTGNNRPAETDIVRIRWLLTTTELNTVDRDEAFIDTADPVQMDAVDYIGQKPSQVMSDVSQQSGKNYWIKYGEAVAVGGAIVSSSVANPTVITTTTAHGLTSGMSVVIAGHTGSTPTINGTRVVTVTGTTTFTIPVNVTVGGTGGTTTTIGRYQLCYFNAATSELYPSALSLSNVASEINSTTVFAISDDTRLSRAGGRAPTSGVYLPFTGGYVYEQDTLVGDTYVYRDVAMPAVNVKTAAKATARAELHLLELADPDDEVETEIIVQAAQLNDAMHGMWLPLHATHLPAYYQGGPQPRYALADGQDMRIMRRQVRQLAQTTFGVRLWLTPMKPIPCPDYDLTPDDYYPPLGTGVADADGYTIYSHTGLSFPEEPAPFFGSPPDPNPFMWHFNEFMTADAGAHNPAGWVDGIFGVATNIVRMLPVGPGTAHIYTRQHPRGTGRFNWRLEHRIPGGLENTDAIGEDLDAGDVFDVEVPDDGFCVHYITLDVATSGPGAGPNNPGGAAFDGWDWTGA